MKELLKGRSRATQLTILLAACFVVFLLVHVFKWVHLQQVARGYSTADVDKMTYQELFDYIRWTNSGSCKFERDFGDSISGKKSICLDHKIRPEPENCLVYSFGAIHDWAFDEAMAEYGCDVLAFDPMVEKNYTRSERIRVYKLGLRYPKDVTPHNWTSLPISKIYRRMIPLHGIIPISILKLDMEDFDFGTLVDIVMSGILPYVKQIGLKVHLEPEYKDDLLRDFVEILQSIETGGFVRFASNGIPSSYNWHELLEFEGYLDYEINWFNNNFQSNFSIS